MTFCLVNSYTCSLQRWKWVKSWSVLVGKRSSNIDGTSQLLVRWRRRSLRARPDWKILKRKSIDCLLNLRRYWAKMKFEKQIREFEKLKLKRTWTWRLVRWLAIPLTPQINVHRTRQFRQVMQDLSCPVALIVMQTFCPAPCITCTPFSPCFTRSNTAKRRQHRQTRLTFWVHLPQMLPVNSSLDKSNRLLAIIG